MAELERPRSSKKTGLSPLPADDLAIPHVGGHQQCMETTKVQNPEAQGQQAKLEPNSFNYKKIAVIIGLSLLVLTTVGLAVGFGLKVKSLLNSTIIYRSEQVMTTKLASGATLKSVSGELQNAGLDAPIPFTFTSISLPAVRSPSGRLLQQAKTINSIDYFHKDTETCVSYDVNFKPELRISIDSAVDYVLQYSPQVNLDSLETLPDNLKKILVSDSSLQGALNGPVDFGVSYDGVYDPVTQKFNLTTQQAPYVKEQYVKIDPKTESTLIKTTPNIKNGNNVKQVSEATASVVKEILNTVSNVVEVNREIFDVRFKNSFKDDKEVKAASEAAGKALGVIKGCCVVSQNILRCSKKVWESGELPVANLKNSHPLEVPELILKSQ